MPPPFDVEKFKESWKVIMKIMEDINKTVLLGWPFEEYPNRTEAEAITSAYNELTMQEVTYDLTDDQRWKLSGQIVARIRRDARES